MTKLGFYDKVRARVSNNKVRISNNTVRNRVRVRVRVRTFTTKLGLGLGFSNDKVRSNKLFKRQS